MKTRNIESITFKEILEVAKEWLFKTSGCV